MSICLGPVNLGPRRPQSTSTPWRPAMPIPCTGTTRCRLKAQSAATHFPFSAGWANLAAFVERLNLTLRQHVAAIGRRVSTLCKGEDGLRQQLALYHVYYNFCLPHASVRQPLPQPVPTHGTGSAKQWRPRTPAMAAGLTDHVWTLREVLLFRVPPWPQPAGRCARRGGGK